MTGRPPLIEAVMLTTLSQTLWTSVFHHGQHSRQTHHLCPS
jgi:hypothetical protein